MLAWCRARVLLLSQVAIRRRRARRTSFMCENVACLSFSLSAIATETEAANATGFRLMADQIKVANDDECLSVSSSAESVCLADLSPLQTNQSFGLINPVDGDDDDDDERWKMCDMWNGRNDDRFWWCNNQDEPITISRPLSRSINVTATLFGPRKSSSCLFIHLFTRKLVFWCHNRNINNNNNNELAEEAAKKVAWCWWWWNYWDDCWFHELIELICESIILAREFESHTNTKLIKLSNQTHTSFECRTKL